MEINMKDFIKNILLSKAVWTAIVIIGCFIGKIYGIEISSVDQTKLIDLIMPVVSGAYGIFSIFLGLK
jgi:hypothetical protein